MKYIMIIIGILLLTGSGFTAFQSKKLLDEGIVSKGKVVGFDVKTKKEKNKTSKMYYPIVSFQDDEGQSIEFKSNTGSNPKSYNVGEMVEVIYKKGNSENASVNGFTSMWLLPIILGVFGLIIFAIGFAVVKAR